MANRFLPNGLAAAERLIVALDFNSAAEANRLIGQLGGAVNFYKVGWQLFLGEGWPFIRSLLEDGRKVFLDLKINDIDQTVQAALANMPGEFAGSLELLTINGGSATASAAKKGRGANRQALPADADRIVQHGRGSDLKELSPDGAAPWTRRPSSNVKRNRPWMQVVKA